METGVLLMASLMRPVRGRLAAILALTAILAACDNGAGDDVAAPPMLEVLVIEAEKRNVSLSIDMVGTTPGGPVLIEVELIEPSLYLGWAADLDFPGAEVFAAAVIADLD